MNEVTDPAMAEVFERHKGELRVHCYRILGSLDESEDLVQETFLRAWRSRETYRGDSGIRAWLYRIATNACLDFLARHPRPALPGGADLPPVAVPWLQPYPDRLLEAAGPREAEPDTTAVARETIELAFMAAIQYLSPRERAAVILRDVLGWPSREIAELLEASVGAVNSALQRARVTLRSRLPRHRLDWQPAVQAGDEEREVLRRFMEALERADDDAVAAVLRQDARAGHQAKAGGHIGAEPTWYRGRDTVVDAWAPILHGPDAPELRFIATQANRQPALGGYIRVPGEGDYHAFSLTVLSIENGAVAEIATFGPELFPAFDLPHTLGE